MIELDNHSPFPAMVFEKAGYKHQHFDVLAIRGTFLLRGHNSRAVLDDPQAPLVTADTYWGDDPLTSSLKFETDLVIGKLCTDIHIIGHAHSPQRTPMYGWEAGIRIGDWSRMLKVHGPREWRYSRLFWRLESAAPVERVPLRYELAYGGSYLPRKASTPIVCEANPIGTGFYEAHLLDTSKAYPAPQIETLEQSRFSGIETRHQPQGFGPLSRWWTERQKRAGTYDDVWKNETWPYWPADLDPGFYNSAPPEMQWPGYLAGNERLWLIGLLPGMREYQTALGNYQPICVVEDNEHQLHTFQPRLDTLTIDTDAQKLHQTWRLTLPKSFGLRHVLLGAMVPPPEPPGSLEAPRPPSHPYRDPEEAKLDSLSWLLGKGDN